jgi:hypothetical protein
MGIDGEWRFRMAIGSSLTCHQSPVGSLAIRASSPGSIWIASGGWMAPIKLIKLWPVRAGCRQSVLALRSSIPIDSRRSKGADKIADEMDAARSRIVNDACASRRSRSTLSSNRERLHVPGIKGPELFPRKHRYYFPTSKQFVQHYPSEGLAFLPKL